MKFGKIPGLTPIKDKKTLRWFRKALSVSARDRKRAEDEIKTALKMMEKDKTIFAT